MSENLKSWEQVPKFSFINLITPVVILRKYDTISSSCINVLNFDARLGIFYHGMKYKHLASHHIFVS